MGTGLRVLIIEDSVADTELLLWELRRGGFEPEWERVETEEAMAAALERQAWDVIIADFVLPGFGGLEALQLLQAKGLDIPFIVLSGKVGEETAVEAMRAGAHDYLLKGNLARLLPAIRRELAEAAERAMHRQAEQELRILKEAIETIPIGVTITDPQGKIIYTNPAEAAMHGMTVGELLGKHPRMLAPAYVWNKRAMHLENYVSSSRESVNIRRNGETFPVQLISNAVHGADGGQLGVITICEDITARKQVEAMLRKQQAAMESSMDGMVITDENNRIVYANQAQAVIYGYGEPEEFIGRNWEVFYGDREVGRITREILPLLVRDGKWRGEAVGVRCSGRTFPQEISLTVIEGGGVIWVVRDITERKQTEERLRFMSTHDSLTGLYNRAYFELELERLERSRQFPISVVMVDVDGLKLVNDTKGHAVGDRLLQQAAKVLGMAFRAEDMVARVGGDEFVVLLPEADALVVDRALQRIRTTLEENHFALGEPISLSLGAATAREPGTLLETIQLADERMYEDKLTRLCRDRRHGPKDPR